MLVQMRDRMAHRGPDDQGRVLRPGIGLGHRRLSIIDLKTGHQPIPNETHNIWVVCNGEIYNFSELRLELEQKGHVFKTKTDTEVIVHAYEEWGTACIHRFRGMFAFGLWDESRHRLLLVRDRLGIKPLYYAQVGAELVFASEIKALLAHPKVSRDIDPVALDMYLRLQFIPAPRTIFRKVRKLAAGHYLLWERDKVKIQRYWKHRFEPEFRDEAEWLDALEAKILESVRIRLISDVPLGAFLSGGVDSSVVVLAASRYLQEPVQTFAIGFEDPRFDERNYASQIAEACGADHHVKIVPPGIELQMLEQLVAQLDEPMSDGSLIPTFHVSRLAREKVTVVLSGDGGDETFAGYSRKYGQWLAWQGSWGGLRLPAFVGRRVQKIAPRLPWGRRTMLLASLPRMKQFGQLFYNYYSFNHNFLPTETLYGDVFCDLLQREHEEDVDIWEWVAQEVEGEDLLTSAQHADFLTYLPEDILMKVDKMSMLNSLEVRVPLLDHEVQELAARVPATLKWRNGTSKYILKRLLERWGLPKHLIHREKLGFGPSTDYWFAKGWCVRLQRKWDISAFKLRDSLSRC